MKAVVPCGHYMATNVKSENEEDFCLVSIVVSPGFDPADDAQAQRKYLLQRWPQHKDVIERFTQPE